MSFVFYPSAYPGERIVAGWTSMDEAIRECPYFLRPDDVETLQILCALESNSNKVIHEAGRKVK